jgi:two-component system, sensor histidine kinase YesM
MGQFRPAVNGADCLKPWIILRPRNGRRIAGTFETWYIARVARYRSVRESIFLSVSLLLTGVLLVFSLFVYDYASAVARERFSETLTSLSRSLVSNLDAQLGEMDRLSLSLIYSRVFQNLYSRHLSLTREPATPGERIARLENAEALVEIMDTILGPNQSAPQINVYDPRGEMIGAGFYSRLIERDAAREAWHPAVAEAAGGRVILAPHLDALLEETSVIVKGKRYVSLIRSFSDPLLSTSGIVEVEQYCDVLFGGLEAVAGRDSAIYVIDAEGRRIYPYQGDQADEAELLALAHRAQIRRTVTWAFPGEKAKRIIAVATSAESGWTLLLGEPAAGLTSSIFQYAVRIAVLAAGAILLSLAASYFIARRVTVPLKALHAEIEALELANLRATASVPHAPALGEIDELRLAFRDMRHKLDESIKEAVSLREHERRAQLVALQSQLNPHFLHNMLQTIAIMVEESTPSAVQGLIQDMTKVLRYASSSEGATATLGTEIDYAESYLAAMRARFGEGLSYRIELPESMRGIEVPRLILQPLIENCFKHGTTGRPPWRIEVRGSAAGGRWTVEVLDDGPGFSEEALARLDARFRERRGTEDGLVPLSISGMGLLSSRERLRLTFGEEAEFEAGNRPGGGARVALGGPIHG